MSNKELDKQFEEYKRLQAEQHNELMDGLDRAKKMFVKEITKLFTVVGALVVFTAVIAYIVKDSI
jgi:hypothetical protein